MLLIVSTKSTMNEESPGLSTVTKFLPQLSIVEIRVMNVTFVLSTKDQLTIIKGSLALSPLIIKQTCLHRMK